MKKIFTFFIFILSVGLQAQNGAKIEFKDKDNTIDYGTVSKETDNGIRVFEFTNTGDADLIVTNVQSSCGCTVPSKPKDPIKPGQTGKIEIKYNMNPGPIRKTITVESNAINTEAGKTVLKIKGYVATPNDAGPKN